MDQSECVAQPTPGTSSGTDSTTIPPVLTEQDIPGAALNAVNEFYSPRPSIHIESLPFLPARSSSCVWNVTDTPKLTL